MLTTRCAGFLAMLIRCNLQTGFVSRQLPGNPQELLGLCMRPTHCCSRLARCWLSRSVSLFNNQHRVALINCHAFDVACNESERGAVGPGWVKTDMTGGSGLITTAQACPGACYPQRVYRAVYAACHRPAQFVPASRMDACMVPQVVSGPALGPSH